MDAADAVTAMAFAFVICHVAHRDISFDLLDFGLFVTHLESSFLWIYTRGIKPLYATTITSLSMIHQWELTLYSEHILLLRSCKNAHLYAPNSHGQTASLPDIYRRNRMLHSEGTCTMGRPSFLGTDWSFSKPRRMILKSVSSLHGETTYTGIYCHHSQSHNLLCQVYI